MDFASHCFSAFCTMWCLKVLFFTSWIPADGSGFELVTHRDPAGYEMLLSAFLLYQRWTFPLSVLLLCNSERSDEGRSPSNGVRCLLATGIWECLEFVQEWLILQNSNGMSHVVMATGEWDNDWPAASLMSYFQEVISGFSLSDSHLQAFHLLTDRASADSIISHHYMIRTVTM